MSGKEAGASRDREDEAFRNWENWLFYCVGLEETTASQIAALDKTRCPWSCEAKIDGIRVRDAFMAWLLKHDII